MTGLAQVFREQVLGLFNPTTQIIEIDGVVDLYDTEAHQLRISKTSQPIETGSSITDNAIIEPRRLTMQGFVSNIAPPEFVVSVPAPERGKEAWARIVTLAEKREPVTILTMLELYENFLITGLDSRVDSATGTSLEFVIQLEEILFADSEFVTLPASSVGGPAANRAGTVEGGQKQSPEATGARGSLLSNILGVGE